VTSNVKNQVEYRLGLILRRSLSLQSSSRSSNWQRNLKRFTSVTASQPFVEAHAWLSGEVVPLKSCAYSKMPQYIPRGVRFLDHSVSALNVAFQKWWPWARRWFSTLRFGLRWIPRLTFSFPTHSSE